MNEPESISEDTKALFDDYLDEVLDEAALRKLESELLSNSAARALFVEYCELHTDMYLQARAGKARKRILSLVNGEDGTDAAHPESSPSLPGTPRRSGVFRVLTRRVLPALIAACVALAAASWWWFQPESPEQPRLGPASAPSAIAWLVNAQDCQWSKDIEPSGDLLPGRRLRIDAGLAALSFRSGARIVLQGPAEIELTSDNSAKLISGRLTANVPESAAGFSLLSPQGEVIDLGTEFGMSVAPDGSADVVVFKGKVTAREAEDAKSIEVTENQAAVLDKNQGVLVEPTLGEAAEQFVRAIVPRAAFVPRTLNLDFRQETKGSIQDAAGLGTGLTHRLPGTGQRFPGKDKNLELDTEQRRLVLHTTDSNLDGQHRLYQGEYVGVRLSDLGFTGTEDFAVTVAIPDVPSLRREVGQLGLYAGVQSDKNIRGGLVKNRGGDYTQFLVHNVDGKDSDPSRVGLLSVGDDLRLTLSRTAGKYAMVVENRTTQSTNTLSIRDADFLDGQKDLYVGLFAANVTGGAARLVIVTEFKATVWIRSR